MLGLFSGIATLALGALFNTQTINNKLLQSQAIMDNANLSLQTITREIRYGTDFYCTNSVSVATTTRKNCPSASGGGVVLLFKVSNAAAEKDRVVYFVNNGILYKKEIPFGGVPSIYQMTTDDVYITQFKLYVDGANSSTGIFDDGAAIDYTQPKITIFIAGHATSVKTSETAATFNIQTTVSPRSLDNS